MHFPRTVTLPQNSFTRISFDDIVVTYLCLHRDFCIKDETQSHVVQTLATFTLFIGSIGLHCSVVRRCSAERGEEISVSITQNGSTK